MKTINEDKLVEFLNREKDNWAIYPYTGDRMAFFAYKTLLTLFEEFEVDAIPIEWIKKWTEQFYKEINGTRYYMGDGYDTVWDMLEDWEKENESRDTESTK